MRWGRTTQQVRDMDTRRARVSGKDTTALPDPPEISKELVEWLELAFPAKCYAPGGETLEDHLLYAGKVGLVAMLRVEYQEQQEEHAAFDTSTDEDGTVEAELPTS